MRSSSLAAVPLVLVALVSSGAIAGCSRPSGPSLVAHGGTFGELRTIKGDVTIAEAGAEKRAPYPRERVAEGAKVELAQGALAWLRRDSGATWLVAGPASLTLHDDAVELTSGRAFVDGEDGPPIRIDAPRGAVELSDARASVEVGPDGKEDVYVLRGAARAVKNGDRAIAGELLAVGPDGAGSRSARAAWDDWTGGLATADPAAQPAPFGLGTVGARPPGDKGKPRFSLVIERLDVKVTIDRDFAITEVDQTFVNPSSETVEGIFRFRTPQGAALQKFGVDRDGAIVWGKVKESAAAQAQYESNVYQGSQEDPALLAWTAPGEYNARLYPIQGGAKRRVVTRYTEWLPRQGKKADRRLYVYPMAAEGARGSLPRIEEMRVSLDLSKAGATKVRAGMNGEVDGKNVVIRAFDFVPRADLAVELYDGGESSPTAYRAPHVLSAEDIPMNADAKFAAKVASEEPDYLVVPLRSERKAERPKGIDLAIVVDTSAATEPGSLAIARSLTGALLAHLGPDDRVALWAGDASLRPVGDGSGELGPVDAQKRRAWLSSLAGIERGGATDLGAILTEAATKLGSGGRQGAVLYIGDGTPSVGELTAKSLHERLARLPASTRVFAAGIGSRANVALLDTITRGAKVEPIGDAYSAARAALRLLEAAERPAWIGATLDVPGVERILPQELPPIGEDETVLVVGRLTGKPPSELDMKNGAATSHQAIRVVTLDDEGDMRRRWGQGRMQQLLGEGAGRASLVDVGRRYGLVSPYTSLYVPTAREVAQASGTTDDSLSDERADAIARRRYWRPWSKSWRTPEEPTEQVAASAADNKEGGTGTRAKGEEGSMGNPNRRLGYNGSPRDMPVEAAPAVAASAYAAAPAQAPPPPPRPASDLAKSAPAAPWGRDESNERQAAAPTGNLWGDTSVTDSLSGLTGTGEGGGGRGSGIGLGNIGTIGHGAGTGTGQGFGNGHGALGGAHATKSPTLRQGATTVSGRLPPEVVQRIVRQNFGRFRICYENSLRGNPTLAGRVTVRFVIDRSGAVTSTSDNGSDMPDRGVVACVTRGFANLSFPQPEGGGAVTVDYPILFSPDGESRGPSGPVAAAKAATSPRALGAIGHAARPCGAAAELPISERSILWSERLAANGSTAVGALGVYSAALEACEAPSWRERTLLLLAMVERLPTVSERVALWKSLIATPAADVVYRAIVVRVQNVTELHELHRALGLASVDPDLLAAMVAKAKTPADKLSVLRAAAVKWPDDFELSLRVLDAFEDAADDAGGRAWARKMRRRVDATAHVWTSVGEYYLRLASRGTGPDAEHDRIEARRTFGELVEFAPDDPAARRRLGDLLRAHGWYEEALRQYATLRTLTPDDPSVDLLMASAAQGLGRVEEAVGWTERAAAAGSPDGESALSRAARATALAFVGWARDEALRNGKKEDAEKLLARARRLGAAGTNAKPGAQSESAVRILVTWSHPELHPSLWTTALGTPMPSPDNFPLYGVAEAKTARGPASAEIRLEPEDAARAARLGLVATVTVIAGSGTAAEKVVKKEVSFGTVAAPIVRTTISFDGQTLAVAAAPAEKGAPR